MTGKPESLLCRDLFGTLRRIELTYQGEFSSPGSRLVQRLVTGANDVPLVHKSVPRMAGRREPRLYEVLDNEIRAMSRLGQVFGGDYPCELAALVGYNVDVEEPFVLLRAYAGEAAPSAVRGLDEGQRRQLQIGMLRALYFTSVAGVIHGELTLRHLRWNAGHVQLVDFESARPAGNRWQRPEGPGAPACREDVWSAGMIIHELVMGAPMTDPVAQQQNHPERLRSLLDGVFQAPEHRPCPAELLSRMRAPVPPTTFADPEAGLADGRRLFDEAAGRKGATGPSSPKVSPRPPGRGRLRRLLSGPAVLATVAAAVWLT